MTPIPADELGVPASRSHSQVARRRAEDRKSEVFNDLMRVLSLVLDFDEGTKLFHAWRVALVAREVGRTVGLDADLLFHAGLVHDLGGLGLSDHVVHHARLGFSHFEARGHASRGARILRPLTALRALEPLVAHHHERWDGTGFPNGLAGWEIPIESSAISFADQLDVTLRHLPEHERGEAAVRLALDLRGTACPPEICEAALAMLEGDASILRDLYDPTALERRVRAVDAQPAGLEEVPEIDLLAQLLWVLARVVDTKHEFTMGHSSRVAFHARQIATRLGGTVDPWDVVWAALLHDVGKVAVPRRVLDKVTPLSEADWESVRSHARHTREIVSSISRLSHLALAASAHHEAYDGSGYPSRLAGEAIPLISRILAYADQYDALRSDRPHRPGLDPSSALAAMRAMVGTVLDPALADVALECLATDDDPSSGSNDLLGFQRFFHSDEPSLQRFVRPGAARLEVSDAARWCTLVVGTDGELAAGATTLGELTGVDSQRLGDHVAPASRPQLRAQLEQARRGQTTACTHPTPAGVALEVVVGKLDDGLVAHVRRSSATWQSMRELALVHRNFLLSAEAVLFTDAQARIVDANYAFTRMFGWRTDEILGSTPKFLQSGRHPPSLYREMRESLVDPQVGTWSGELVNRTRSGDLMTVQLTVNSVRDSSGRIVGYVSNAIDVTARRRAQEALEERERELSRKNAELERLSQFKSQMVAITSHDLRAPLASMIGLAELIGEAGRELPPEQLRAQAAMIADAGHRLVGLVNDLLDLDKCESGTLELRPRRASADGIVGSVAETLPAGRREARPVDAPGAERLIVADVDRLDQALQNLVGNALKFSPTGQVDIGCSAHGADAVRFWVADRGPGIPEASIEAVFDRYVQLERGGAMQARGAGAGLGLAIVRHVAELHGGRAFAENREGGGCRFVMELPARGPVGAPHRPCALLVGPRSDDLARAARTFRAGGMCVVHADRAVEAERRLRVEAPALVLVDSRWLGGPLEEPLGLALERARTVGVVFGQEEAPSPDPRFDWALVSPLMDLELSSVMRAVLARAKEEAS